MTRNKLISIAVCLIVFQLASLGSNINVHQIVKELRGPAMQLQNVKIVARETAVQFNRFNPLSGVLEQEIKRGRLPQRQIDHLKTQIGLSVVTNESETVYRLEKDRVLMVRVDKNSAVNLKEERSLITPDEILICREFGFTEKNTNNVRFMGERFSNVNGVLVGAPRFLSKISLANWIDNASKVTLSMGVSSKGDGCYSLEIVSDSEGPEGSNVLLVRTNGIVPLQIKSYLRDGTLYSTTELSFDDYGETSSFCSVADVRVFNGPDIFKQGRWERVATEFYESNCIGDAASFFPEDALVHDKRLAQPISYVQGVRSPDRSELKRMQQNPRGGVVEYEAATRTKTQMKRQPPPTVRRSSVWLRLLLMSILFVPIVFWGIGSLNAKIKRK